MSINRISFFNSDIPNYRLNPVADKIADFLFRYRGQLNNYSELMRISSSWRKNNYINQLQKWAASKRGRRKAAVAPDIELLIDSARDFFNVCQNDDEIKKMRGLVPEKLVEKILGARYNGKVCNKGFGEGVEIDGNQVKYVPAIVFDNNDDSDKNRQSVDAGMWDGKHGEFIEVKFNPEAFHTKDINYLRLLVNELEKADLQHTVYLISMGEKNLTRKRLESLHKWSEDEFTLIGSNELFELSNVTGSNPAS